MAKPTAVPGLGPRVRISDAGQRLIQARLADVRRYERPVTQRMDVDGIHDMRVATRRLRAALKLCGCPKPLDRKVKRFQDALGQVRDVHVQLAWLEEVGEDADREVSRVIGIVTAHLKRQLPRRASALREELRRWSTRTVQEIRAAAGSITDSHRLGGSHFRTLLRSHIRRVGDEMKNVLESPDARAAHLLRIEVKKLRYLAELLEPAWPEKIEVLLGILQPLQEALGNLHDADVRVAELTTMATILPQSAQGMPELLNMVQRDRERLADKAVRLAVRWRREHVVRGMRRLLAENAGT